jgi:hypothetical protein
MLIGLGAAAVGFVIGRFFHTAGAWRGRLAGCGVAT